MKQIVVLGSTGSIGVNTLKVVGDHPEEFEIVGLSARNNVELLRQQVRAFKPRWVALQDESRLPELERLVGEHPIQILGGEEGIVELAGKEDVDLVVVAITGAAALKPTLAAIARGRRIGLANKETLVMCGELMMDETRRSRAQIIPIDSEHSAIFQCLEGHSSREIRRILLTTSGGPLKDVPLADFGKLTKAQVMKHPRWNMGPKITVDSATMMNKALEVIEARWLFGVEADAIEVLVHPEAIVHSLVEYIDGSVLAQLAVTDMRIPIQYAMTYPKRLPSSLGPLNLVEWGKLTFESPKREKFPCLDLGFEAARVGGTQPAVFNAANEACVTAFLADALPFTRIPAVIEEVLSRHRTVSNPSLAQILEADAWAHEEVKARLNHHPVGVER